ncbi:MAG: ribonuclease Z [Nanoarchaeota archaeon]|nr:ribonuclease Z [Nanoarchaeota archaeon]
MENVKISFLGTGNAVPTEKRNHTAILLSFKNENILLDCGEGTQRQFKIARISPNKITRILITHWHGDHILGLPGLFQTLAMSEYSKTLHIYGPKGTSHYISLLKNLVNISIPIEVKEISGKFLETPDFFLEAHQMEHGIATLAYSLVIKDQIRIDKAKIKKLKLPNSPLLGKLQQGQDIIINNKKIKSKSVTYLEKGKKVTIILDTSFTNKTIDLAKNSDLLICESTFSKEEESRAKEYKHLTSVQAATIAKKAKVKQLILTHISQRYENNPEIIEGEAKKIFKNTKIVKDFDSLIV